MSNVFGRKLKVSIFGESHSAAIGVTIDGLPAGFAIDMEDISREMLRRAPGRNALSTSRFEGDEVEIICGFFQGKTTGSPLTALIQNTNTRSKDYNKNLPRPGHADYVAHQKYGGNSDYRGGGHFSGRITAPLTFAGTLCRQILAAHGVEIKGSIVKIGDTAKAKESGDSVGGIIECTITGIKSHIGSPFFASLESELAAMMFSVPAVKGIEFGAGFAFADMLGSQANDAICYQNGAVVTETNHNGGINGGIANGMPIVFRVVIKPTPSIFIEQDTVDLESGQDTKLTIKGRHDPSIVPRALPVIEAGAAIVILDAFLFDGVMA